MITHVDKTKLLEILGENKKKHVALYNETIKGFKLCYIDQLNTMIFNAKRDEFEKYIDLKNYPESHEKDYNKAIRMVELEIGNEIRLDEQESNKLLLDDWSWSNNFSRSVSSYSSHSSSATKGQ